MSKSILFILVVSFFASVNSWSASTEDIKKIESIFNSTFFEQIQQKGYTEFEIFVDENIPEYYGGVNIVNQRIRFIVGSKALTLYNVEALKFISCHELGHIIGGAPFKPKRGSDPIVSTEGQSDYWAGKVCLQTLTESPSLAALEFFTMVSLSLRDIVGDNSFYAIPKIDQVDDFYYDTEYSSFQCRLNTVVAGERGEPRPACWYRP